jgi:hypothetical protein
VNEVLGGISRVTFQMGVSTLPHQKVLHAIEILGSVVSAIVMNAGDRACPETSPPCPHPSSGCRKPARTPAGKADGTDVLLANVESQHRHAAQLNTHAHAFVERLIGTIRREYLDHLFVLDDCRF